MRKLRTEVEIISGWKGDLSRPIVSICCATYNHEKFIEDALEGFLIQQTNFPLEILIHDDASTDNTASIIGEYQEKYPFIIKPVFQSENQYSRGKSAIQTLTKLASGGYIAICEGDDFWTDPNKLKIQIDFLESNPEYVISGHDAFVIDEEGNCIKKSRLPSRQKRDFTQEELIKAKSWIPTMSRVYRNVVNDFPPETSMARARDKFYVSLIGHFGKSKYHDDIKPAAYRVHSGGVWSMTSKAERLDSKINTSFWISRYYKRVGEQSNARYFRRKYLSYVFRATCPGELFKALVVRMTRWGWQCDK